MPLNDVDINGGSINISNEITGEIGEVFNDLGPKKRTEQLIINIERFLK